MSTRPGAGSGSSKTVTFGSSTVLSWKYDLQALGCHGDDEPTRLLHHRGVIVGLRGAPAFQVDLRRVD